MSVDSRRVQKWKEMALSGLEPYKDLIENLVEDKVPRLIQNIEDIPQVLKITTVDGKEHRCKFSLEYDEFPNNPRHWFVRYKDESGNVILETSNQRWDFAIFHMQIDIMRSMLSMKITDEDGNNLVKLPLDKHFWIKSSYKIVPERRIDECPYCGTKRGVDEKCKTVDINLKI